jgi:hypothetical protein
MYSGAVFNQSHGREMKPRRTPPDPLLYYTVMAPTPVLESFASLTGICVHPVHPVPGYSATRLALNSRLIGKPGFNRALIVSENNAPPKQCTSPEAKNQGPLLQAIRNATHSVLHALDLPKEERYPESIRRIGAYIEAAEFATGDRTGWPMPRAFANNAAGYDVGSARCPDVALRVAHERMKAIEEHQPRHGVIPRPNRVGVKQNHKSHKQRNDVYWLLQSPYGHKMYIRSGSAVSDTIEREGWGGLPAEWTLKKVRCVNPGGKGTALAKIIKIANEISKRPGVTNDVMKNLFLIIEYIRRARKSPDKSVDNLA